MQADYEAHHRGLRPNRLAPFPEGLCSVLSVVALYCLSLAFLTESVTYVMRLRIGTLLKNVLPRTPLIRADAAGPPPAFHAYVDLKQVRNLSRPFSPRFLAKCFRVWGGRGCGGMRGKVAGKGGEGASGEGSRGGQKKGREGERGK